MIEAKHDVLLKSLEKYYDNPAAFETFKKVVTGKTHMSLRVLDWLVTNYAKKNNIVYMTRVGDREVAFNLFLEYKSCLKAYSKRLLDPFCRRGRVSFRGIETTCGQLNFFRWAITYGVLDYATKHHDTIEGDMLASIQHRYGSNGSSGSNGSKTENTTQNTGNTANTAKRKELSKAAIKSVTATTVKVVVKFS
jgi:hypothetical protein